MPILIRKMTANDIKAVVKVQYYSQRQVEYKNFSDEFKQRILLDYYDLCCVWSDRLNDDTFNVYVAFDSENEFLCGVVGFQGYDKYGYIRTMYVHPDYLREHIGSSLFKQALLDLYSVEQVKGVRLEVLETNIPAISFYKNNNFKETTFNFPKALGGTAQALFVGENIKVIQMERIFDF